MIRLVEKLNQMKKKSPACATSGSMFFDNFPFDYEHSMAERKNITTFNFLCRDKVMLNTHFVPFALLLSVCILLHLIL